MNESTTLQAPFKKEDAAATSQTKECFNPIPSEKARPCFVVLDESFTASDDSHYRPGVWLFSAKPGKGDAASTLEQHWVCSPLHVDAVTFDAHGGSFGRLLRFRNTLGKWCLWSMPMEMLRSDGSDLRGMLLSMGVHLDPGRAGPRMLATYLQSQVPQRRMEAVMQTGWASSEFEAYALPDTVIGPHATRFTFQSDAKATDEYTQRGTLEEWQQSISALAIGNPMLVLAVSTAFSGPLLARLGMDSGGLHLIGDSSTGKTTALQAAASVWGGDNFRRSWRTTANGLEGAAALFNDGLLALDEISECDPRDVGEVVYMLGNGRGKQRASRTGAARSVNHWRTSVISTGERSIATCLAEAGQQVKAGQAVRLLDIPMQRPYGAWDCLHAHTTGPAFSDAIKRAVSANYGTAGRAFLEKLTRDHSDFASALESIKNQLLEQARTTDGQPTRAAARLSVVALAGELATTYGITGWAQGDATKAAAVAFSAWLAQRGNNQGNAEQEQIAQAVLNFIDRHGDSRFSDANANYDDKQQIMVRDRAGWWRSTDEGLVYYFTKDGMHEALKGFDFTRALKALRTSGLLEAPPTGEASKTKRIHGRISRVYIIRPDKAHSPDKPKL